MNTTKLFRVCALNHEALGTTRVKVIFREGGYETTIKDPKTTAYWMTRETYRAIPLGALATVEDYQKYGAVVEAQNTDIYSNL